MSLPPSPLRRAVTEDAQRKAAAVYGEQGIAFGAQNDFVSARSMFTLALKAYPQDCRWLFHRANNYTHMKLFEEALFDLDALLTLPTSSVGYDSVYVQATYARARCELMLGRAKNARSVLQPLLSGKKASDESFSNEITFYLSQYKDVLTAVDLDATRLMAQRYTAIVTKQSDHAYLGHYKYGEADLFDQYLVPMYEATGQLPCCSCQRLYEVQLDALLASSIPECSRCDCVQRVAGLEIEHDGREGSTPLITPRPMAMALKVEEDQHTIENPGSIYDTPPPDNTLEGVQRPKTTGVAKLIASLRAAKEANDFEMVTHHVIPRAVPRSSEAAVAKVAEDAHHDAPYVGVFTGWVPHHQGPMEVTHGFIKARAEDVAECPGIESDKRFGHPRLLFHINVYMSEETLKFGDRVRYGVRLQNNKTFASCVRFMKRGNAEEQMPPNKYRGTFISWKSDFWGIIETDTGRHDFHIHSLQCDKAELKKGVRISFSIFPEKGKFPQRIRLI